jgi:tetratricopeptide (TPR) repeat protein
MSPYHPEVGKMMDALGQRSDYFFTSATGHVLTHQYSKAIEELTSAIELFPYETRLYELRASCYRKYGQHEEALSDLKVGLSLCWQQDAAGDAEEQSGPNNVQQRRGSTLAKEQGGMSMTTKIEIGLADTFNDLAMRYFREEKYLTAIRCLNRAVQCYTKPDYFMNRGDCYRLLHELHRALADYHSARDLAPKHPKLSARLALIHNEFGRLFYNSKQHEKAHEEFSTALQLFPNWQYLYFRGKTNLALTRLGAAHNDFHKALQLNPHNQDIERELYNLQRQKNRSSATSKKVYGHVNVRKRQEQNVKMRRKPAQTGATSRRTGNRGNKIPTVRSVQDLLLSGSKY